MEWDNDYKSNFKTVELYTNVQYSKFKKVSLKLIKPKAGYNFRLGKICSIELDHFPLIRTFWMLNSYMKLIIG